MNKIVCVIYKAVVTYAIAALCGSALADPNSAYLPEPKAVIKAKVSMQANDANDEVITLKPQKTLSPSVVDNTDIVADIQDQAIVKTKAQKQLQPSLAQHKPTRVSVPQVALSNQDKPKSRQVLLAPIVVLPAEDDNQDVESRLHLKSKKQQVLHPAVVALPDESPKPMLVLQPKVIAQPAVVVTSSSPSKSVSKPKWVKPSKTASFSDQSLNTGNKPKRKIYQYEQGGITTFSNIVPDSADFEVLLYDCFACQVNSQVDWHRIPLFASKHSDFVSDAAEQFDLDPALIRAVIHAESAFNAKARSKVGAIGLMQLMPATAKELGVSDAYDIKQNILGGSQYLAYLLKRFDNDIDLACAAYNAGPTTVTKYQGIPPYPETQAYVERVKILLKRYRTALQS